VESSGRSTGTAKEELDNSSQTPLLLRQWRPHGRSAGVNVNETLFIGPAKTLEICARKTNPAWSFAREKGAKFPKGT